MMNKPISRILLTLAGIAGLGILLAHRAEAAGGKAGPHDFSFVQLSDIHWGFKGPAVNPDAEGTLKKTIQLINALDPQPDFVVCTGDLTHTTDDPKERSRRLAEFRDVIGGLKVKDVRFLPGEHDAALDSGAAYKAVFGETHYSFEHKGVHFIVLDNVSDPLASLGETQLQWLSDELKKLNPDSARVVVFTHRPLFDLYPPWEWWTRDGARALDLLAPFKNVAVFYGHIHQNDYHVTGQITHYAARGMMYPLSAPGSVPKRAPIPWDSLQPYAGLGFRRVEVSVEKPEYVLTEFAADQPEQVISITARKFEFSPKEIVVRKGVPVILELTSEDRLHGFTCPDLGVRADVQPGKISRVRIQPQKAGSFEFHCDIFCGEGHPDMTGNILVEE